MKIRDYIFKLTKTKRIKKYINGFPQFEFSFPDGWRQIRINEPIAFYHEESNSGLTIYMYKNNVKTRKVYSQLLLDTYDIKVAEDEFEDKFLEPDSFMKLIIDSDQEYSERVFKLIKKQEILVDICLVGNPKDKKRNIELFSDWERVIKKL